MDMGCIDRSLVVCEPTGGGAGKVVVLSQVGVLEGERGDSRGGQEKGKIARQSLSSARGEFSIFLESAGDPRRRGAWTGTNGPADRRWDDIRLKENPRRRHFTLAVRYAPFQRECQGEPQCLESYGQEEVGILESVRA